MMLLKLLNRIGLTTIAEQREAERRQKMAEEFARMVAEEDDAAIILGEDYQYIHGSLIPSGKRILVVPGARYCTVHSCFWAPAAESKEGDQ